MPSERERRLNRERQRRFQERKRKRQIEAGTRQPGGEPRTVERPRMPEPEGLEAELLEFERKLFGG